MIMINEKSCSRVWFSSDYHFYHANVIKYCDRPFKDVDEMNAEIVRRHNSVVGKTDLVFCLGDISFKHCLKNLHGMNGSFIIVYGNHDDKHVKKTSFKELVIEYYNIHLLCTHKPQNIYGNFNLNVVGHVHGAYRYREDINAFNVGVDVNDFYPVSLSEVLKYCR